MKAPNVQERLASIRRRLDEYAALPIDELYQVKDDLVLLRVLRDGLLERVEADEPPAFRERALSLYIDAREAMESDPGEAGRKLSELGLLLECGVASDQGIDRLLSQTHELIKRCIALEDLRIKSEKTVSVAELERFARAVVAALRAELPDEDCARVLERLNRDAFNGRLQICTPNASHATPS